METPKDNEINLPNTRSSGFQNSDGTIQEEDEPDVGISGVAEFEDLLKFIGTFGKWNIMVFLLCYLSPVMNAFQVITYEFVGATPDHWCRVEPLIEANWTQEQILDFAIPSLKNGSVHDQCQMYSYNYTRAAELGYESAKEEEFASLRTRRLTVSCSSRVFNLSQYKSTLVTEYDLVCERKALYSTTQAVSQFGDLVGSISIGPLNDLFGRRKVSICFVVLTLVTGLAASVSPSLEFYITMKTLVSACSRIVYTSCFVTMIEMCSTKQRSSVGSLFLVPWAIGYMLVPGIAYLIRPWRWLQAAYTLPNIILLSYFWLLPESPRWLISKGRYEEALKVFTWAAKVNKKVLPSSKDLIASMKKLTIMKYDRPKENCLQGCSRRLKHLFVLLATPEFRMRAIICGFCWFSVSNIYYGISLSSGNLSADPYLFIFLGGLVEVPSYILLWPSVAYLGRKFSLISQYIICGVAISTISILMGIMDEVPVGLLMFLSLSGKLAITATFHLLYIYTSELFPTKYRSLAVGESSMMARVGSMASPYINDILGASISWGPSALFSGLSALAAGLALFLPETKGVVMNEDKTFEKSPEDGQQIQNEKLEDDQQNQHQTSEEVQQN